MKPELILVANATEARLFRLDHQPPHLALLAHQQDAQGHLKASELTNDRLGHAAEDHRPGGTSFTPRTDPRQKQHLAFARTLAEQVDEALARDGYERVSVFASSPFLGELKQALGPRARHALHAAIDLDLTSFAPADVLRRVEQVLQRADAD